ncbi:hypothetical protein M9H77_27862 [Catharanthus roseus]|uniref:Uncharacterized protein n=1 Tax=Catharanthus roseus TaxID=4058 RepID=A0ACC0AFU9_CATRO|nr:hypothetical protein M9H77_27862 [Catharanthus roseus]
MGEMELVVVIRNWRQRAEVDFKKWSSWKGRQPTVSLGSLLAGLIVLVDLGFSKVRCEDSWGTKSKAIVPTSIDKGRTFPEAKGGVGNGNVGNIAKEVKEATEATINAVTRKASRREDVLDKASEAMELQVM